MRRSAWVLVIVAVVLACAQEDATREKPASMDDNFWDTNVMTRTVSGTASGAWDVVQAPFEDIGLKEEAIPPLLQQVVLNPYAMPPLPTCRAINDEIHALNAVLGSEKCTFANPTGAAPKTYTQQGADLISEQAVGLARSKTSILPFRGVVRRISGAEKHSREVAKAYEAGKLRRAFLRGLAATNGCQCEEEK